LCLAVAARDRDVDLVCLADRELLRERAQLLGIQCQLVDYRRGGAITRAAGALCVWHHPLAVPCRAGTPDARNAAQVLRLIDCAADGCRSGEFSAMVTAPVQKSTINASGVAFTGHTEYIAKRLQAALPVMLLVAGSLRVALATTHLPLRDVSAAISTAGVLQVLTILHHDLQRDWGLAQPHIAVCGLNPHAGENGYLGDEEQRVIEPALAQARVAGMNVDGPYPADTLFVPKHLVGVDAVLAMYHDQGLPVLKHAGFGEAVNVTLGLPIVRTSVDHGTALALAGSGAAESGSLLAAIALATELATRRATVRRAVSATAVLP
jgi:4-hydroxythreonine-4-phosphate dehydrogenase